MLYEEAGSFKVGSVLAESDASLQVEAPHGKRSKIKAASVLLRFEVPPLAELIDTAEALAAEIDIDFLWQCCGDAEFAFSDLAREYCGHTPNSLEAAAILITLQSAPPMRARSCRRTCRNRRRAKHWWSARARPPPRWRSRSSSTGPPPRR